MKKPKHTTDLGPLIRLVHHRWNIQIIAELSLNSGSKYVSLLNRLAISRASLSAALAYLIDLGYVQKNTGHGHPMRPEYLLTDAGIEIGRSCLSLVQLLENAATVDLAFRKWTLPLVAAIGRRNVRFNSLHASLVDATPRALTIGLKLLLQYGWVSRSLIDDFPPTAAYELKPAGRRIHTSLTNLCRAW